MITIEIFLFVSFLRIFNEIQVAKLDKISLKKLSRMATEVISNSEVVIINTGR